MRLISDFINMVSMVQGLCVNQTLTEGVLYLFCDNIDEAAVVLAAFALSCIQFLLLVVQPQ